MLTVMMSTTTVLTAISRLSSPLPAPLPLELLSFSMEDMVNFIFFIF